MKKFIPFMMLMFFLGKLTCDLVNFIYAGDQNYKLSIITNPDDSKSVRLIDTEHTSSFDISDKFEVLDSPTKIYSTDGYICGHPRDPSVQLCTDQEIKSMFTFEKKGEMIRLRADNGQCLTKAGIDTITGGYFLNLKTCNMTNEQQFIKSLVLKTNDTKQRFSYSRHTLKPEENLYPFLSPYDLTSNGFRLSKQSKYYSERDADIGINTRDVSDHRPFAGYGSQEKQEIDFN